VKTAILLIYCPDRKGIVATVANFLYRHNADILHADQHQDKELGLFFMRVEFGLDEANDGAGVGFDLDEAECRAAFAPIADEFAMSWRLEYGGAPARVALFVSQHLHCLADLLSRREAGELRCDFKLIVSNHEAARPLAEFHRVPFHHLPVDPRAKALSEKRQLDLLAEHQIDLVVLARYMQILSPEFVARYPLRIINVHHSFLPAFIGAKPYHAAFARGVKLIGSTSHYVTEALDDGPIIEQDVCRVSHRDQLGDLIQKGRDLERLVLSRAVKWHVEHRILSYANKTVILD
jgi:formyltetrahydrofolate deformylase